jgi:hypothetical protein
MADSIMDWPNKCCSKCRKPLVYEELGEYSGWRLDCKCWDDPPTVPSETVSERT